VEFNEGPESAGPGGSATGLPGAAAVVTADLDSPSRGFTACRRHLLTVLIGLFLAAPAVADPLLTFPISIRGQILRVEVAATEADRRIGLMHRRSLGANQGMVFTYDKPGPQAMWMKNTLIPLSVAFVGKDSRILNIEDMQPLTEVAHGSLGDAAWSIEANLGWFRKHGIRPGDRVEGLSALPRNR
jgi:uncharacterized membrane protein (UPF0127 family)